MPGPNLHRIILQPVYQTIGNLQEVLKAVYHFIRLSYFKLPYIMLYYTMLCYVSLCDVVFYVMLC
jgi:hypothetical protein